MQHESSGKQYVGLFITKIFNLIYLLLQRSLTFIRSKALYNQCLFHPSHPRERHPPHRNLVRGKLTSPTPTLQETGPTVLRPIREDKITKRSLKFQLRPKCLMHQKGLFIGYSLETLCLNLSCPFGYWTQQINKGFQQSSGFLFYIR